MNNTTIKKGSNYGHSADGQHTKILIFVGNYRYPMPIYFSIRKRCTDILI